METGLERRARAVNVGGDSVGVADKVNMSFAWENSDSDTWRVGSVSELYYIEFGGTWQMF